MVHDPEHERSSPDPVGTPAVENDGAGPAERRRGGERPPEASEFRVEDRRHWLHDEDATDEAGSPGGETLPRQPTVLDEYRERAEAAERRLKEYIEAYRAHEREQEAFRERLTRDIERRTRLRFAEMVAELLQTAEDLDLARSHADAAPESRSLAQGLALARDRFLGALGRQGIETIDPLGRPFDPRESEALRVDAVDTAEQDGVVTETLQQGYRLGDHVIRPARVAVGRHAPKA